MPAKNSVKQFAPDSYYHLYNRGVEKRIIFLDEQDYGVFLSYIKTYLLPKDTVSLQKIIADPESDWKQKNKAIQLLHLNNFNNEINITCFCLMPNHFHLLIRQTTLDTIDRFMNSLCSRYVVYFNKRHKRVGPLFQGLYKAVLIKTDEQLLHLSRYIHRNPDLKGTPLQSYSYSSYPQLLGLVNSNWVNSKPILDFFLKSGKNGYRKFVEDVESDVSISIIKDLIIDDE